MGSSAIWVSWSFHACQFDSDPIDHSWDIEVFRPTSGWRRRRQWRQRWKISIERGYSLALLGIIEILYHPSIPGSEVEKVWGGGGGGGGSSPFQPLPAPPIKLPCTGFNSDWAEGRMWLKRDQDNSVMFCEWCRCFNKNEHRNQLSKGAVQWSWRVSKNMNSQGRTKMQRQHNTPVLGHNAFRWSSPYRPWNKTRLSRWNTFSTLHFTSWKLSAHFVISLLCCSFKGWMVCKLGRGVTVPSKWEGLSIS